jgi:trimeric autotransporter adhesin
MIVRGTRAAHRPAAPPPPGAAAAGLCALLAVCGQGRAQCTPEWSRPAEATPVTYALATFDETGTGRSSLFVGGPFTRLVTPDIARIARWDGRTWSPLGEGVGPSTGAIVYAITGVDFAAGKVHLTGLYAGGSFQIQYGAPGDNIARWSARAWNSLDVGTSTSVRAIAEFEDPVAGAPLLYVGGTFTSAGGIPALGIARWDGTAWSEVGGGLRPEVPGQQTYPNDFAIFDDGSGPALYVGGSFWYAGGIQSGNIARWDGRRWSTVGSLVLNTTVWALGVYDDGSGESLYVGGGGFPNLRRWDGQNWHTVPGWNNGLAAAMLVHDDGSGPELYVAGDLRLNGGVVAHVASWDGVRWRPLPPLSGLGPGTNARTLAAFQDDPAGRIPPALYVGGDFTHAGGVRSPGLARWGCPHPTLGCYADCDLSWSLDFFDLLCFQNAFLAGDPYADCDRNGTLDFFDFLCFQNEFLASCP